MFLFFFSKEGCEQKKEDSNSHKQREQNLAHFLPNITKPSLFANHIKTKIALVECIFYVA